MTAWRNATMYERVDALRERARAGGWSLRQVIPPTRDGDPWIVTLEHDVTGAVVGDTGDDRLEAMRRAIECAERSRPAAGS